MKKINKIALLSLLFFFGVAFTVSRCQAQSRSDNQAKETVTAEQSVDKEPQIRKIGINRFKKEIYDFDAHPSEFVYQGSVPAIVDFYADWCGPCRKLAPKLEAVAKKYGDKLIVYKVNIDENPQLAYKFSIQSIPAVLFVPVEGKPLFSLGDLSLEQINKYLVQIGLE